MLWVEGEMTYLDLFAKCFAIAFEISEEDARLRFREYVAHVEFNEILNHEAPPDVIDKLTLAAKLDPAGIRNQAARGLGDFMNFIGSKPKH